MLIVLVGSFITASAMAQGVPGFRYEVNTTHPGGDYKHFGNTDVNQCANECARDFNCLSFSFDKVKRTCWLKNSVPPIERNHDIVSGVKEQQSQNIQMKTMGLGGFNILQQTTLPGSDYNHFRANSVDQCASQCGNDPRCRAFAFDNVKRTCWLKDRVPPMERNGDITAGIKR